MSFHILRFGEKSAQHPAMRPRGVDNRLCIPEQQPKPQLTAPARHPSRPVSAPPVAAVVPSTPEAAAVPQRPPSASTRPIAASSDKIALKDVTFKVISDAESDAIFKRVDFNGNGSLSLAEVDKAVLELWPEFDHKPAIMRAFKLSDDNNSGLLSKKEFRAFVQNLNLFNALFAKFQRIDTNGDRKLTRDELRRAGTLIEELKGVDTDALFDRLDTNRGGSILFEEFCTAFVETKANGGKKTAKHAKSQQRGTSSSPVTAGVGEQLVPAPKVLNSEAVSCPLCLRKHAAEDLSKCVEQANLLLSKLQTTLRGTVLNPPPGPEHVKWWLGQVASDINQLLKCPECEKRFAINQVNAYSTHFREHNVLPARLRAIFAERHWRCCQAPPPPVLTVKPDPTGALKGTDYSTLRDTYDELMRCAIARTEFDLKTLSAAVPSVPLPQLRELVAMSSTTLSPWKAAWLTLSGLKAEVSQSCAGFAGQLIALANAGGNPRPVLESAFGVPVPEVTLKSAMIDIRRSKAPLQVATCLELLYTSLASRSPTVD